MILPDVNVLIYAFRPDATHHQVARALLEQMVQAQEPFALSLLALTAVVRVTTAVGRTGEPSTLDEAFGFCNDLRAQQNCQIVEPGERHWTIFQQLCLETNTRGRMTTDAWFAALAIEWGCEWVTFDRDFRRFPGLRCTILPAAAT
jgi:uncharacterized protein